MSSRKILCALAIAFASLMLMGCAGNMLYSTGPRMRGAYTQLYQSTVSVLNSSSMKIAISMDACNEGTLAPGQQKCLIRWSGWKSPYTPGTSMQVVVSVIGSVAGRIVSTSRSFTVSDQPGVRSQLWTIRDRDLY